MTSIVKQFPCEGCRERKKKCNFKKPCERCERIGSECVYMQPKLPRDVEYVQMIKNYAMGANVKEMAQMMTTMEDDLRYIASALAQRSGTNNTYRRIEGSSAPMRTDTSGSVETVGNFGAVSSKNCRLTQTTQKQPEAEEHEQSTGGEIRWAVSIRKDGLRIDTNIQSYHDLLRQFQSLQLPAFVAQPSSTTPTYLARRVISFPLRRGYFEAIQQCINTNRQVSFKGTEIMNPADQLTLRIVDVYFSCQFQLNVILHQQTFLDLFLDRQSPTSSAVICALCAAALTARCHHIHQLVPTTQQGPLSAFYCQRARNLVSSDFDEPSLGTFTTFVLLAMYHTHLMRPDSALRYMDMALRMKYVLDDMLKTTTGMWTDGQQEMYNRLHMALGQVANFVEFAHNRRGIQFQHMERIRQLCPSQTRLLKKAIRGCIPKPMPDETPFLTRAILAGNMGERLHYMLHRLLYHVKSEDSRILPVSVFHKTKAAIDDYYFREMPPEFRPSPEFFRKGLSSEERQRCLRNDPNADQATVYVAIKYQRALLSMHEPLSPYAQNDDTNQEPLNSFSVHSIDICYEAASTIVDLLEYHIDTFGPCHSLMRGLIAAFDAHLRNACLEPFSSEAQSEVLSEGNEPLSAEMIQMSRSHLLRCIAILRKSYCYNPAEHYVWKHHEELERRLMESMFPASSFTISSVDPILATTVW